MVSPLSLYLVAGVLLLLAAGVGRLRRIGAREALADGRAALVGSLVALTAATVLFAVSRAAASEPWRTAGSVALLASPLGAALALRTRSRRSLPRALLAAGLALTGVTLWLTLNLRGPWGGWTWIDVAQVLPAAAVSLASAACLGWWSRCRRLAEAGPAAER